MAKPIGYYSKDIDGETQVMAAYEPADQVRYTFDGWRDVTGDIEAAQAAAKQAAADAKPAKPK